MRWILDALVAFFTLGFTEAVVKPVATRLVDRQLRRALPYIYEHLDNEMPSLLRTATPELMTSQIAASISKVTGEIATPRQIEQVVSLYSPIAAALRNAR
jgi:hypothetical protein